MLAGSQDQLISSGNNRAFSRRHIQIRAHLLKGISPNTLSQILPHRF